MVSSGVGLDAIVCHGDDTVATAVRELAADECVRVSVGGDTLMIGLAEAVPFGHKFALRDVAGGQEIIKYGETIGRATSAIRRGEHVHLHNVEGLRGRGDLR
jgi:altronate dehydratase small subunit